MKPQLAQMNREQLFFAYFMDCQTPQKPGGGPNQTWDIAELAVRGIADLFERRGLIHALELCIEPEVAWRQADMFREMKQRGAWLGLHFQARGYRPHGANQDYDWEKPLSFYDYEEQLDLLTIARDDWQQALGMNVDTFGACCATTNDYTHPILDQLGFRQCVTCISGRYNRAMGQRWYGAFPFSRHCSSKSRLVPGDLDLYEVPPTSTLNPQPASDGTWRVNDYRAEREMDFDQTMAIAEPWLQDMLLRDHPLLYLYTPTHNTWDTADLASPRRKAVETAIDVALALAEEMGLQLVSATLAEIHAEADRLNAY